MTVLWKLNSQFTFIIICDCSHGTCEDNDDERHDEHDDAIIITTAIPIDVKLIRIAVKLL